MMQNSPTAQQRPADFFISRLRTKTAPAHRALEELPISKAIVSPTVSRQDYAAYLNAMADAVHDLETHIFPRVSSLIPDLQERRKLSLILEDLAFYGAPKSHFRQVFTTGENTSEAFAMGIVYVMEGSVLGGRMILKNLDNALGMNSESGARYFHGYGTETGSRWKSFMEWLAGHEAAQDCSDDIIRGANHAFAAIHQHFLQHS